MSYIMIEQVMLFFLCGLFYLNLLGIIFVYHYLLIVEGQGYSVDFPSVFRCLGSE